MKIIKILVLLGAVLGASAPSFAAYTQEQEHLLDAARIIGEDFSGMPETIQSLLLVESNAGAGGRVGDKGRSIGVMQVRPETAEYVTNLNKHLPQHRSYYHYAVALMNDYYSIGIGTLYFKRCMDVYKNWRRAVVCYNQGVTGASRFTDAEINDHWYLNRVRKALKNVRAYRLAQASGDAGAGNGPTIRPPEKLQRLQLSSTDNAILCNVIRILPDVRRNNERRYIQRTMCVPTRERARGVRL